ncbi:hypothetical protein HDU96_001745, partial [Phlyctochytrium bullatum]
PTNQAQKGGNPAPTASGSRLMTGSAGKQALTWETFMKPLPGQVSRIAKYKGNVGDKDNNWDESDDESKTSSLSECLWVNEPTPVQPQFEVTVTDVDMGAMPQICLNKSVPAKDSAEVVSAGQVQSRSVSPTPFTAEDDEIDDDGGGIDDVTGIPCPPRGYKRNLAFVLTVNPRTRCDAFKKDGGLRKKYIMAKQKDIDGLVKLLAETFSMEDVKAAYDLYDLDVGNVDDAISLWGFHDVTLTVDEREAQRTHRKVLENAAAAFRRNFLHWKALNAAA